MNRNLLVAGSLLAIAGCAANVDDPGAAWTDGADETEAAPGRLRAGDVIPYEAETPHPYVGGWKQAITSPGAAFVRVHFTDFSLAKGDHVTVSSPDGSQSFRYEDRGPNDDGELWAFAIDGETAVVELHSSAGGGHGFSIADIGHGTVALDQGMVSSGEATPRSVPLAGPPHGGTPEVVCATDGREDIACHPELDAQQKPVARLLFTSGGGMFVCTGWLIAGTRDSTLITNNHCISTQSEADTLETLFGYQSTTCGGSTMAGSASFAGGTVLKTNGRNRSGSAGGLDYTLIALPGSPEATWGELTPTTRAPRAGDPINFIQHPGGSPKKVGYWKDRAHTLRCQIDAIDQTYYRTAVGSQTGYSCDSEGGSSGSPIVHGGTGKVVALHHLADVGLFTCRNGGTEMSAICADAGGLLSCVRD
ncbi:trypsin-like serine peptidase [Sorangium sp. So ce1078]|uniref:trypsin-like serine peptidase n=1 Tax=Sorangium sp. So ce1078 TaxID=3133329 RepID=UPI003F5F6F2B